MFLRLPLKGEPTTLEILPRAASGDLVLEILDLRHFSSADLRPLLDDETQLWSRLLSWDYSGSAEMILRYVDAKILPGYAAVERGRVFGYSFFVYEGSKGVIGDLYVANGDRLPDARQVELRLLAHVIETLCGSAVAGPRRECSVASLSRNRLSAPSAAVHGAQAREVRARKVSDLPRG